MAYSRRVPGYNFDHQKAPSVSGHMLDTQHGISELKVNIGLIQQRLKKLDGDRRKTSFVSQESAHLIKSVETTLVLCQSTYKKLEDSNRRIVYSMVTDTLRQIHKALHVVSRFSPVD